MTVTQVMHRLGGVATRAALVRNSSRRQFDRAVAAGEIVRDARGRYALPVAGAALREANALGGVVSHRSAALHWGWEVKTVPERPDVTIRRKRHLRPGQASGVTLHWADLPAADVDGIVTTWERTLVDCIRSLRLDEALAIADSALRHRDVSSARLVELAARVLGPGAPQARRVAREADPRAANPFESVLRAVALDVPGLDLQPQVVIGDRHGQGRPDLVDQSRRLVIEAESYQWHGSRKALRRDCRRYTRLVLLGWHVLRFSWEDVMFEQAYVRDCLLEAAALAAEQAGSVPEPGAAA
jgi:very-short-patch-repair endonuclease